MEKLQKKLYTGQKRFRIVMGHGERCTTGINIIQTLKKFRKPHRFSAPYAPYRQVSPGIHGRFSPASLQAGRWI